MDTVKTWFVPSFRSSANGLFKRFGAPVYLVGSALTLEHPRDIDVRIILCACEMQRLYGHTFPKLKFEDWETWQWRRAVENIKQSRQLLNWGGYPIDFQVQSMGEAAPYKDKERVRLDTAPDWVLLATVKEQIND